MTKLPSADCWGLFGRNVPPFILEIRWSTSRIKNMTTKFQNFLPRKIFNYFSWKLFHSFLQYKSIYQQARKLNQLTIPSWIFKTESQQQFFLLESRSYSYLHIKTWKQCTTCVCVCVCIYIFSDNSISKQQWGNVSKF